jgi:hypothetical protein
VEIRGIVFLANLIVMGTQGMDVILGMNWLDKYQAVISCDKRTIKLVSPLGEKVVDALSRKSQLNMMVAHLMPYELAKEFDRLSLGFLNNMQGVTVELEPTLEREIKEAQKNDEKISEIRRLILDGKGKDFREDAEGVIWFKDRLCVPNVQSIRELILKEAHETAYSIHPGSEKMYQYLKKKF